MRKIVLIFLLFLSLDILSDEDCVFKQKQEKIETRVIELEKENAVLKEKLNVIISENDKKFSALTWPVGIIITLLGVIYGFGAFRSIWLAKQEARKAFEESFEKLNSDIKALKEEAEKELSKITTIREAVEQR